MLGIIDDDEMMKITHACREHLEWHATFRLSFPVLKVPVRFVYSSSRRAEPGMERRAHANMFPAGRITVPVPINVRYSWRSLCAVMLEGLPSGFTRFAMAVLSCSSFTPPLVYRYFFMLAEVSF